MGTHVRSTGGMIVRTRFCPSGAVIVILHKTGDVSRRSVMRVTDPALVVKMLVAVRSW